MLVLTKFYTAYTHNFPPLPRPDRGGGMGMGGGGEAADHVKYTQNHDDIYILLLIDNMSLAIILTSPYSY
jgi:hypothetical protein